MSSALITGGGGTAAREAASARSASRALCGVSVVASRSGSSGMIWATTGSSGVIMRGLVAEQDGSLGNGRGRRNLGILQGRPVDFLQSIVKSRKQIRGRAQIES